MFQFGTFPTYDYVFIIRYTFLTMCRFPHSEIHGYNGYLLLTVAYRSLSRPSSAPDAKAFPLCSFLLQLQSDSLICFRIFINPLSFLIA